MISASAIVQQTCPSLKDIPEVQTQQNSDFITSQMRSDDPNMSIKCCSHILDETQSYQIPLSQQEINLFQGNMNGSSQILNFEVFGLRDRQTSEITYSSDSQDTQATESMKLSSQQIKSQHSQYNLIKLQPAFENQMMKLYPAFDESIISEQSNTSHRKLRLKNQSIPSNNQFRISNFKNKSGNLHQRAKSNSTGMGNTSNNYIQQQQIQKQHIRNSICVKKNDANNIVKNSTFSQLGQQYQNQIYNKTESNEISLTCIKENYQNSNQLLKTETDQNQSQQLLRNDYINLNVNPQSEQQHKLHSQINNMDNYSLIMKIQKLQSQQHTAREQKLIMARSQNQYQRRIPKQRQNMLLSQQQPNNVQDNQTISLKTQIIPKLPIQQIENIQRGKSQDRQIRQNNRSVSVAGQHRQQKMSQSQSPQKNHIHNSSVCDFQNIHQGSNKINDLLNSVMIRGLKTNMQIQKIQRQSGNSSQKYKQNKDAIIRPFNIKNDSQNINNNIDEVSQRDISIKNDKFYNYK